MILKLTFDVELTEEQVAQLKGQLPPAIEEQPHLIVGSPDPPAAAAEQQPASTESLPQVQEPGASNAAAVSGGEGAATLAEFKDEPPSPGEVEAEPEPEPETISTGTGTGRVSKKK